MGVWNRRTGFWVGWSSFSSSEFAMIIFGLGARHTVDWSRSPKKGTLAPLCGPPSRARAASGTSSCPSRRASSPWATGLLDQEGAAMEQVCHVANGRRPNGSTSAIAHQVAIVLGLGPCDRDATMDLCVSAQEGALSASPS